MVIHEYRCQVLLDGTLVILSNKAIPLTFIWLLSEKLFCSDLRKYFVLARMVNCVGDRRTIVPVNIIGKIPKVRIVWCLGT